jgi:hypothetical protein
MTRSYSRRIVRIAAIAVMAGACGGGGAPKVPLALAAKDSNAKATEAAHELLGPIAQAALDSGNALFRKKEYVRALAKYRAAAEAAPQHSAPLFGIYMVAQAMNDKNLADSALAGIRARNGPLQGPSGAPHAMSDSALRELRAQMKKGARAN